MLARRLAGVEARDEPRTQKLERELEEANGGAGVYSANLHKRYMLADESWKDDIVPEIMDGHNVADFLAPDKDIMEELERLEEEETRRDEAAAMEGEEMEEEEMTAEEKAALSEIRYEWGRV